MFTCLLENYFTLFQVIFCVIVVLLGVTPKYNILVLKKLTLIGSYFVLALTSVLGLYVQNLDLLLKPGFNSFPWVSAEGVGLGVLNFSVSLDALSYLFILLTAILMPLIVLSSWNNIKFNTREFFVTLVMIEWLLINMFLVTDLLLFYIFFEAILLPMFFLIGTWGSRQRKTYAAFMFFFYTFLGSLFLLLALFLLYSQFSTLHLFSLISVSTSITGTLTLWPLFMIAFAVKVPMFPAHIWLPEAHVEAPTVGSVLLAGILLKLGVFAVLRFLIPIFPSETQYYSPLVCVIALLGILYVSLTTIRQIDLKKIIAYASVAHMNYVVIGLMGTVAPSLVGCVFLMIGHGIVSAGLFFIVGFLYDRYKTRNIRYYRGLVTFMPLYALTLFIFSLANMSFPGTCNFIGEAFILFGVAQTNVLISALASMGIIFCAIYTIWLFNRTMYGPITPNLIVFSDLSLKEFITILPLLALTLLLGFIPGIVLNQLNDSVFVLLEYY